MPRGKSLARAGALWYITDREDQEMKRPFSASVIREGEWFVAQCLELDVASQGATEEEALDNLREALELHFTPPRATITPSVRKVEAEIGAT